MVHQEPQAAGDAVQGAAQNPQVTDHDAPVDDQGHATGAQGTATAPPVGRGDDSRSPRPPEPINAASPVEFKTPPGSSQPESREEAMVSPGPTRCGPARRGPPEEARVPT